MIVQTSVWFFASDTNFDYKLLLENIISSCVKQYLKAVKDNYHQFRKKYNFLLCNNLKLQTCIVIITFCKKYKLITTWFCWNLNELGLTYKRLKCKLTVKEGWVASGE